MSEKTFTGGCGCGQVRYRLESPPMFTHCCHCLDCQRQAGTAFALNAMIEADRVIVTEGVAKAVPVPAPSGRPQVIFRCPSCEIALWSTYGGSDRALFVRVGTLDEPHAITPDAHIYVRSKVPWVALPAGVPAFEEFYRASEVWPPAAMERRKAMPR
jgi:hypothetical protein